MKCHSGRPEQRFILGSPLIPQPRQCEPPTICIKIEIDLAIHDGLIGRSRLPYVTGANLGEVNVS
jgi:hypothetical protein